MYGLGDVAWAENEKLEEIKKKIRMYDLMVLTTRVSMNVNEIFAFHDEIVEMIKDVQNMC